MRHLPAVTGQIVFAVEPVSALPAAVDEMHTSEVFTSKID